MRTSKNIQIVSCHAEGEVGDVVVGGVAVPPGTTLWEQREFLEKDKRLWHFLLNEPRGGVFRHINLIVPARNPEADLGFIIMEPEFLPPMSGSNAMCVATVALDTGLIPMQEPITELVLEAPGGLVKVIAECRNGKAENVTVFNMPAFVDQLDVELKLPDRETLSVDIAFGGDSFVIVNAADFGFEIKPEEAALIARTGVETTRAANQQIGFTHPGLPDWSEISFCLFATPVCKSETKAGTWEAKSAVVVQPGKVDRSPTGTATCARMAVLHARGIMQSGDRLITQSIIGSEFQGEIVGLTDIESRAAILPSVKGRAWITGTHQYMLDPSDPWAEGYRLHDTWPKKLTSETGR